MEYRGHDQGRDVVRGDAAPDARWGAELPGRAARRPLLRSWVKLPLAGPTTLANSLAEAMPWAACRVSRARAVPMGRGGRAGESRAELRDGRCSAAG